MALPPISDETCELAAKCLRDANGNQSEAAKLAGDIPRSTFQNWVLQASRRGKLGFQPVLPGYIAKTISTQTGPDGVERTWVKQEPDHGGPFNVPDGHSIKGVSALLDPSGNVRQQWVRTKAEGEDPEALADAVRAALAGFEPVPATTPPKHTRDELATVYPLADFHVGLLAWKKEVGHDYDLNIAERVIKDAAVRLFASSPPSSQAVILGLGDLLHADNFKNLTPQSGNALDVDGRYPKSLRVATELILHFVSQALQQHDKVLVRILPGNHDEQSAIAVSLALAMYYANEPRVTVDDSPSRFWFWSWGDVLLGATHGDKAKMADLPLVMASRCPEAWGRAKFRHIYTGHVHIKSAIEVGSVTAESFQTPSPGDAWHHGMGYGAGRSLTAITHHAKLGEIMRNKVNVV